MRNRTMPLMKAVVVLLTIQGMVRRAFAARLARVASISVPQTFMEKLREPVTLVYRGKRLKTLIGIAQYDNGGSLAVELYCKVPREGFVPYWMASVNVPGTPLGEDEFIFKTYSENEGVLEAMLTAGLVEVTGRYADIGPICRLLKRHPQVVAE